MLKSHFDLLSRMGLPQTLLEAKKISASLLSVDANQVVFSPGDSCGAFLILTSGQLRVDMTTRSGREILLYRMKENDSCVITTSVLLNHEKYYARATTETSVDAIAIPTKDFFIALNESAKFAQIILKNYSQKMSMLIQLLDKVTSKDILFELCSLLIQRCDADNTVKMTQEAIATEIGTAREVVSRKLSSLEEEGILLSKRGRVEIVDHDRLAKNISM